MSEDNETYSRLCRSSRNSKIILDLVAYSVAARWLGVGSGGVCGSGFAALPLLLLAVPVRRSLDIMFELRKDESGLSNAL